MPRKISYSENKNVPKPDEEAIRIEAKKFYNSKAWKLTRNGYYRQNPLCERCHVSAEELGDSLQVHHKIDRRFCEDPYDWANLQTLCRSCHLKARPRS